MKSQILAKLKLPDVPGVYFFKHGRKILYIGKATSLRDRVRSYFRGDIAEARGPLIAEMLKKARGVSFQKTDSVLEALLLEAELIKKHQPFYNTDEKDDKSWNMVVITREDFPQVLLVRKKELENPPSHQNAPLPTGAVHLSLFEDKTLKVLRKLQAFASSPLGKEELILPFLKGVPESAPCPAVALGEGGRGRDFTGRLQFKYIFGPFPQGGALQEGMKIIRKIFPYRDAKCFPPKKFKIDQGARGVYSNVLKNIRIYRPCFNRQIGLCPGTCTGEISKEEYAKTIRNIKLLFQGKKPRLLSSLRREMNACAKRREFEKAAAVKKTIFALEHIQDVSLLKHTQPIPTSQTCFSTSLTCGTFKIEGYDVAHLGGAGLVGVMTVVEDGEPAKSEYRKFRIRGGTGINPVRSQPMALNPVIDSSGSRKGFERGSSLRQTDGYSASNGVNDIAALKEVLARRLTHREWPLPSLIVVDGSEPQKRAAEGVLRARGLGIPVVAVVKDERHRPARILGDAVLVKLHEKSILLANSEAHRFALSYHRRFRSRKFLEKF